MKRLAEILPFALESAWTSQRLRLIARTTTLLSPQAVSYVPPSDDIRRGPLATLAEDLAEALGCFEVSILLRHSTSPASPYQLVATNWTKPISKLQYRADPADGLTGCSLQQRAPLRLFDLLDDNELADARRRHPKLCWLDSLNLKSALPDIYSFHPEQSWPPISWLSCPVFAGDTYWGLIRCCAATGQPYYFSDSHSQLLAVIATQIGHYWHRHISSALIQAEADAWRAAIASLQSANASFERAAHTKVPDVDLIEQTLLSQLCESCTRIRGILVRRSESPKATRVAAAAGEVWGRKGRKLASITNGMPARPTSTREAALRSRESEVLVDAQSDSELGNLLPNGTLLITTAIHSGRSVLGFLDIITDSVLQVEQFRKMAALIASQFGMYETLGHAIQRSHDQRSQTQLALMELSTTKDMHRRMFEDLAHQVRGPISQAYTRAVNATEDFEKGSLASRDLKVIRGLCGKSRRATESMSLVSALSDPTKVFRIEPQQMSRLYVQDLLLLLIQAADDNQAMIEDSRRVRLVVDRESINRLGDASLSVEQSLFEQAINNLLDNARKYSRADSVTRIFCGRSNSGNFSVTVASVTHPQMRIRSSDISRLILRGERGNLASYTTGEGSGIGLWVVDQIMKAHGGNLVLEPTRDDGITEVRLVFVQTNMERQ